MVRPTIWSHVFGFWWGNAMMIMHGAENAESCTSPLHVGPITLEKRRRRGQGKGNCQTIVVSS